MKVHQMISILKRLDQNLEVIVHDGRESEFFLYSEHSVGLFTPTKNGGEFIPSIPDIFGVEHNVGNSNAVCLWGK